MEKRKLDDAVSEKFRLDEDETLNDKVICAARIDSYFKNNQRKRKKVKLQMQKIIVYVDMTELDL